MARGAGGGKPSPVSRCGIGDNPSSLPRFLRPVPSGEPQEVGRVACGKQRPPLFNREGAVMGIQDWRKALSRFMRGGKSETFWEVFGYPEQLQLEDYWRRYKRDGIGRRIIRAYPDACWRGQVVIGDSRGTATDPDAAKGFSEFAAAWAEFADRLGAVATLARADRLARTGHFSIIILGFEGEEALDVPAPERAELVYMQPYAERTVSVAQWDTDTKSPRYGLPVLYTIQPRNDQKAGTSAPSASFTVHHSRVLHISENPDEADTWGEPALQPIWNYLLDLEKVSGGGAEAYWLNARGGIALEAAPDAQFSDEQRDHMRKQVEDYQNEMVRILATQGIAIKPIAIPVADPSPIIATNLRLIAGSTGIPERILTGSERGDLASTTDAEAWEGRVQERRQDHCGPRILHPFIDRMIATGNLPEPVGLYVTEWPEASQASPEKQATIANLRAQAAATYSNSFADQVITTGEFRESLGLTAEMPTGSAPSGEEDDLDIDPGGYAGNPLDLLRSRNAH